MKIHESYYAIKHNLLFCIAVPIYLILFVTVYSPSFSFNSDWVNGWSTNPSFCLSIIAAIELGVLLASRSLLCFTPLRKAINTTEYFIWMGAEFMIACLFSGLFLSLYFSVNYFSILPRIFFIGLCLNIFPYLVYWQFLSKNEYKIRLSKANLQIAELRKGADRNEMGMIRFNDEKGNTKLVVSGERIISLESSGNYVTILYDDAGKLVRYSLRNTLKGLEELCNNNGLVRCHRSFFVNLIKIKVIRRTPDGVFAEIDHPGVENIPVSKTYAPELLRLFSES